MVSDVLDGRFEKEGVCVKENLLRPLGPDLTIGRCLVSLQDGMAGISNWSRRFPRCWNVSLRMAGRQTEILEIPNP